MKTFKQLITETVDNQLDNANTATWKANELTSMATKKSSRENHRKAEVAHFNAHKAWKLVANNPAADEEDKSTAEYKSGQHKDKSAWHFKTGVEG